MVKKTSAAVATIPRIRTGEGALIQVARHNLPKSDGTTSTAFSLDFGATPVPDRKYVADVASVIEAPDGIRLLFAQRRLDKGLRSLLVVHISVDALKNFASSVVDLLEKVDDNRLGPKDIPLTAIKEEPAQTVAFNANFVVSGYAGTEATMDFLFSSAFVLDHVAKNGNQIAVEPIVRVVLPTRLMLNVMKEATDISKKMGLHEDDEQ